MRTQKRVSAADRRMDALAERLTAAEDAIKALQAQVTHLTACGRSTTQPSGEGELDKEKAAL